MAHNHTHDHTPPDFNRAFAIGIILNIAFVLVEVVYGIVGNSLALVADAGHNFSDVMTLLLAWGAMTLANRSATARHTFGFKKVPSWRPYSAPCSFTLLWALSSGRR